LPEAEIVVAGLEYALRHMWERWCAGLPAESFHTTAEAGGQNVDNRPLASGDLRYSS